MSGSRFTDEVDEVALDDNVPSLIPKILDHAISKSSYILKVAEDLGAELYLDCTLQEQTYYDEYIKISHVEESMKICSSTVDQCGDNWLQYRFGRITGSICYGFFTYSKNENADWPKRLKSTYFSEFKGNADMYEGNSKASYQKENPTCSIVNCGIIINPPVPWLGYSPDGIIFVNGEVARLFETKTPKCGKFHGKSTICKNLSYMKDNHLKERHVYYGQVQLGMLLTSLPICDFTLYSYEFDQVYIDSVPFNESACLNYVKAWTHVFFKTILPWLCTQPQPNSADT